jgi:hypothetical protein
MIKTGEMNGQTEALRGVVWAACGKQKMKWKLPAIEHEIVHSSMLHIFFTGKHETISTTCFSPVFCFP